MIVADEDAARRTAPLIERGREAICARMNEIPVEHRPIGLQTLNVVTYDDFIIHVEVCLRHVHWNRITLYVFSGDDVIALASPHSIFTPYNQRSPV